MDYHLLVNCSLVPIVKPIHDHDVLVPIVCDIGYPLQLPSRAVPIINAHLNLDQCPHVSINSNLTCKATAALKSSSSCRLRSISPSFLFVSISTFLGEKKDINLRLFSIQNPFKCSEQPLLSTIFFFLAGFALFFVLLFSFSFQSFLNFSQSFLLFGLTLFL